MDAHALFPLFNYGVLPFWALLILAPRSRATRAVVHAPVGPALFALGYLVLFCVVKLPDDSGATHLDAVMRLYDTPGGALLCWVHYLTFDLFVGAWIGRDALRRGVPHIAVVACLVLTLMLGPIGLLLYLALRGLRCRVFTLDEASAPPAGR